jgi:hypothetical protein
MAIGSDGCFQEGIKFLSNEQQFRAARPYAVRRLGQGDVGWVRLNTSGNDGHFATADTVASGWELIPSPESQAAPVRTRRYSEHRSKGGREVSVTGEPTSQGDIDQRHQSASNQGLSLSQAQLD